MITGATNALKTYALRKYPECNAIIGTNGNHSMTSVSSLAYIRDAVFFAGTVVRIEPEG